MTRNTLNIMLAAFALVMTGCSKKGDTEVWDSEGSDSVVSAQISDSTEFTDLRLFELKGKVKNVKRSTYYEVSFFGKDPVISQDSQPRVTTLTFSELGQYVCSPSELVKRDDRGRIIYWRDNRRNAKSVHPGLLRDTIAYNYLNNNVVETGGMGEFAVTVYDNEPRVVGMFSDPDIAGSEMTANNIYRKFDQNGNWTERLTVWTTRSAGGRPHVSYSLEQREIEYY